MAEASEEYKAHVDALLAPIKGEIAELRAELAMRKGATMAETELACAAPRHRWRIGHYQIEYDHGRWGMNDGCKGVSGHKAPWTAWLALMRWQRMPSQPAD